MLTVRESAQVEHIRCLLSQAGKLSRSEPGCTQFDVCHSKSDPKVFILCERWESEQALDVHRTGEAYTTIYKPQVLPLVERTAHLCELL